MCSNKQSSVIKVVDVGSFNRLEKHRFGRGSFGGGESGLGWGNCSFLGEGIASDNHERSK